MECNAAGGGCMLSLVPPWPKRAGSHQVVHSALGHMLNIIAQSFPQRLDPKRHVLVRRPLPLNVHLLPLQLLDLLLARLQGAASPSGAETTSVSYQKALS
jgi:hypothetical protein